LATESALPSSLYPELVHAHTFLLPLSTAHRRRRQIGMRPAAVTLLAAGYGCGWRSWDRQNVES
jgi:hypothetical protein